jgi:hypothetical protein
VACDATSRLYDVAHESVVFKRLDKTKSYDQGLIIFQARKGALVDLDKLHESVWATRLSGGTRSGLVKLDVTTIGELSRSDDAITLNVSNSNARFVLAKHSASEHAEAFDQLLKLVGDNQRVRVTGQIDRYSGRWPAVLKTKPAGPRKILVTQVQIEETGNGKNSE